MKLVDRTWNENPTLLVAQRISNCRGEIAAWSKKNYVNSQKEIGELRLKLDSAMTDLIADDLLISEINQKLLQAYKAEEEFWKKRSRQLWLTLGDRNTCFFHASTKSRRARNKLTVIEDSEGIPVFEKKQIVEVILNYFQQIFNSSSPPAAAVVNRALTPCISTSTNEALTAIPSISEVKTTLFGIHPDKAPGPDGFSTSFFQSNWSVVGPAITREIQHFFSTGSLPWSINNTHIRLIPKVQIIKKSQITGLLPFATYIIRSFLSCYP